MKRFFSRLGLPQRLAIVCGGLCFLVALILTLVSNLSSRYILQQQYTQNGTALAQNLATRIAPTLGQADLISLGVTLEQLAKQYQLSGIAVLDVDSRQISAHGGAHSSGTEFRASVLIDGNLAGELRIIRPPNRGLLEQERMALGMFLLALLLSLFVAGLAASWGQQMSRRLRASIDKLRIQNPSARDEAENAAYVEEMAQLEHSIERLPLELLQSTGAVAGSIDDYEAAGLLYVRLNSLTSYAETLDEISLLKFTEFQRNLVNQAAQLYEGDLSVARQFGLLLSFSGKHTFGSPACRAAAAAWLIREAAQALQDKLRLTLSLSMACAISEAGAGSKSDIYPGLYSQHIVDDLAAMCAAEQQQILLSANILQDSELRSRAELAESDSGGVLTAFNEPWNDLLARQSVILQHQLKPV